MLPAPPAGLKYLCKAVDPKKPEDKTETRDAITFTGYTDSGAPRSRSIPTCGDVHVRLCPARAARHTTPFTPLNTPGRCPAAVYLSSPPHVELDVGTGAAVAIDSSGWEDTVVWNPWLTMKDCYERFCCVENAK